MSSLLLSLLGLSSVIRRVIVPLYKTSAGVPWKRWKKMLCLNSSWNESCNHLFLHIWTVYPSETTWESLLKNMKTFPVLLTCNDELFTIKLWKFTKIATVVNLFDVVLNVYLCKILYNLYRNRVKDYNAHRRVRLPQVWPGLTLVLWDQKNQSSKHFLSLVFHNNCIFRLQY